MSFENLSVVDYFELEDKRTRLINLISTQYGSLEYFKDFGIEVNIFYTELNFSRGALVSYLTQEAARWGVLVNPAGEELNGFINKVKVSVGN